MAIPQEDRQTLLDLARRSLAAAVSGDDPAQAGAVTGALAERRGCFVTLTNGGRLRGCIGTFQPQRPLAETIVEMAAASAGDPRFVSDPITPGEVPRLTVTVSVLSELGPIDDPLNIELGVHGIYVTAHGGLAGCFLPEVATETGWSKAEFLSQCCAGKAGLGRDAWRDGTAAVQVFTSEKFSDEPQ